MAGRMASWRDSGGPALAVGTAVARAVAAAGDHDRDGYEHAAAELAALPHGQAGRVLAAIVRILLEEQHPDGLDGEDVQAVLGRCVRNVAWVPVDRFETRTVVAVLVSALGVHEAGLTHDEVADRPDPDRERAPTAEQYAWHAPLMIADLLSAARRPLRPYLDLAFTEIARAEAMDG